MRKKPRSYTLGDTWKSYREAQDLQLRIRRQMLRQQNERRAAQSGGRNPTGLSNLWRKFLQSDLILDLRIETHRIFSETMTYLLIVIANILGAWLLLQLVLFMLT